MSPAACPTALLVVGPSGSGKTTTVGALVAQLHDCRGVISEDIRHNRARAGLAVRELPDGPITPIAYVLDPDAPQRSGRSSVALARYPGTVYGSLRRGPYMFDTDAMGAICARLTGQLAPYRDVAPPERPVVVVDEFGPIELTGAGWWPLVETALRTARALVLTVRPALVDRCVGRLHAAGLPTQAPIGVHQPGDVTAVLASLRPDETQLR